MATNNATNSPFPLVVAQGGTGIATATAYAVICAGTTSTGSFQSLASLGTTGYVLTSNGAGALPSWQAAPASVAYVDQASSTVSMAINTAYGIDNGASLVTATLPATAAVGSIVQIIGFSAGNWAIAQNASQLIHIGNQVTTTGTGGSLASTNAFDCITLRCVVANTTWVAEAIVGNITYV